MTDGRLHWGAMLREAVRMGMRPRDFWRLSLKEWRMLTAGPVAAAPMARADFERMAGMWPDEAEGGQNPSTASRSPCPSLRDGEETR